MHCPTSYSTHQSERAHQVCGCVLTNSLNLNSPWPGIGLVSFQFPTGTWSGVSLGLSLQSPRALRDSRDRKLLTDLWWRPQQTPRVYQHVPFPGCGTPRQRAPGLFLPLSLETHGALSKGSLTVAGVCLHRHAALLSLLTAVYRQDTKRWIFSVVEIPLNHIIIIIIITSAPLKNLIVPYGPQQPSWWGFNFWRSGPIEGQLNPGGCHVAVKRYEQNVVKRPMTRNCGTFILKAYCISIVVK